jgi:hypothetical protein
MPGSNGKERMKFIFDYAGLRYDKRGRWGMRTIEFADQYLRKGQETTWLHGIIRLGIVHKGDPIAVTTQSGPPWLTTVVDFRSSITDSGFLDWYSYLGPSNDQVRFWVILEGIPYQQNLLCPGTAYGQYSAVQVYLHSDDEPLDTELE